MSRGHPRSFFAASRLLPAHVRRPAFGLYAFCRLSDDVVDLEGGSAPALARLRQRLARAHRGQPLPGHAIPLEVPQALLEGLEWDAQGRRYRTLIYADIGREVAEAGFDSITRRARVTGARKLQLLGHALATAPLVARAAPAPAAAPYAFLLEAVAAHPLRPGPRSLSALAAPFVRLERAKILD